MGKIHKESKKNPKKKPKEFWENPSRIRILNRRENPERIPKKNPKKIPKKGIQKNKESRKESQKESQKEMVKEWRNSELRASFMKLKRDERRWRLTTRYESSSRARSIHFDKGTKQKSADGRRGAANSNPPALVTWTTAITAVSTPRYDAILSLSTIRIN